MVSAEFLTQPCPDWTPHPIRALTNITITQSQGSHSGPNRLVTCSSLFSPDGRRLRLASPKWFQYQEWVACRKKAKALEFHVYKKTLWSFRVFGYLMLCFRPLVVFLFTFHKCVQTSLHLREARFNLEIKILPSSLRGYY